MSQSPASDASVEAASDPVVQQILARVRDLPSDAPLADRLGAATEAHRELAARLADPAG